MDKRELVLTLDRMGIANNIHKPLREEVLERWADALLPLFEVEASKYQETLTIAEFGRLVDLFKTRWEIANSAGVAGRVAFALKTVLQELGIAVEGL